MRSLVAPLCALLALAACETQPTHEVLALTDLSPRVVEAGEKLVFHASGLPLPEDIRRITLRIAGTLARPGREACARPVSLTLVDPPEDAAQGAYLRDSGGRSYSDGAGHLLRIEGGSRLEVFLEPEHLRALSRCPGDRADDDVRHATLSLNGPSGGASLRVETQQGTVLASARALRGPTLDLLPAGARSLSGELAARGEAERVLASLGVRLAAAHPTEGGLQIDAVAPGSNAERAGLTDGDVLVRLDGVTLLSLGDFRPPHGADRAVLAIRRGESVDDHPIQLTGVTRGVPTDLVATGVILWVALGLLAVARRGTPAPVRWLLSGGRASPEGLPARDLVSTWRDALREGALPMLSGARGREDAVLIAAALISLALAVPFGQIAFSRDPDVLMGHLSLAIVSLSFPSVLAWRSAGAGRAREALAALGRRVGPELLAGLALVGLLLPAGALHAQGVVSAQGAAPWAWNALRDPSRLLLAAVYLSPLLFSAEDAADSVVERAARWTVNVLRAALAAAVLFGGWSVPGVAHLEQAASVSLQMLGVLILLLKCWALVAALRAVTPSLARFHAAQRARFTARVALPWTLAALAVQTAASLAAPRVPWMVANVVGRVFAGATAGLVAILLAARVARIVLARRGIVEADAPLLQAPPGLAG
ncbi:MAG: PDZ domain-containing protein [Polyangiales bacterium]